MKKIVFVCYGMGIGGIEKCLATLINAIDQSKYKIYLAAMNPEYEMLSQITADFTLLDFDKYFINTTDTINSIKNSDGIPQKIIKLLRYIAFRICVKLNYKPWKLIKKLPGEFDIAVAYSQNGLTPYYVIDRVKAKKKILWYHDLRYSHIGKERKYDLELFPKYDNIIAVSKPCADILKANFNVCKDKISVLHNIIDSKTIIEKSNAFIADFDKQFIHFLTVARISDEKGFSLAVQACKYLKNNNIRFKWFWVGDGPQRQQFEKMISDNALEDCFVLMGNQSNPYPYFKACDVYVQTSFTEAYCTTVMEAKVLCKPIVSTQVKSIFEQVIDGKTALISKIDGIALGEKLYEIAADRELRENLTENLLKELNNEENIINEYYELFG